MISIVKLHLCGNKLREEHSVVCQATETTLHKKVFQVSRNRRDTTEVQEPFQT